MGRNGDVRHRRWSEDEKTRFNEVVKDIGMDEAARRWWGSGPPRREECSEPLLFDQSGAQAIAGEK